MGILILDERSDIDRLLDGLVVNRLREMEDSSYDVLGRRIDYDIGYSSGTVDIIQLDADHEKAELAGVAETPMKETGVYERLVNLGSEIVRRNPDYSYTVATTSPGKVSSNVLDSPEVRGQIYIDEIDEIKATAIDSFCEDIFPYSFTSEEYEPLEIHSTGI